MTAAIYCRLSKEDEEKEQESESIQNQKALLIQYAMNKGWEIYQIFCDDDYSGADSNRPAFQKLLNDAQRGKFDVVLCKTQSRFTRDMELVERYIHGKFIEWGIRFVAVVDNADTDIKGNKKARQINGLINEWYLEDLSENIRTVFDYKRRSGQFIGSFPLYGYQKSPSDKNKLIVDPEAAEVIRKIFQLYLDGNGKQQIANLLNGEGIPNPTKQKQLQGMGYVNGAQTNTDGLWNRTSIGRILHERMYTGDLVQGRKRKLSYKSKRMVTVPEDQWIIVPDTHEAIIDKETFLLVQRIMKKRTRSDGTGEVHLLAGKVKCMDCGSTMNKVSYTYKGNRRSYLRCKRYSLDKTRCTNHSIRLDLLEELVLKHLKLQITRYYDASRIKSLLTQEQHTQRTAALKEERNHIHLELERRSKAMRDLYLDKSNGLIEQEQFVEMNRGYLEEQTILNKRKSTLEAELERLANFDDCKGAMGTWDQNLEMLMRSLAVCCIDTVEIGQRNPSNGEQAIRINWLF